MNLTVTDALEPRPDDVWVPLLLPAEMLALSADVRAKLERHGKVLRPGDKIVSYVCKRDRIWCRVRRPSPTGTNGDGI